jgi:potassium-transporting ATPase KdpC subunit
MLRQIQPALISVMTMAILLGLIYPTVITVIARSIFPYQANGSLIHRESQIIGSELIGQKFTSPRYFHPRPSAAGSGYDAASSGGTNLGPTSDKLINGIHKKLPNGNDDPGNFAGIKDLAAAYRRENGLSPNGAVPADAVTRSASGLDPDISPANAYDQIARVAKVRGMRVTTVKKLVEQNIRDRQLGILGEPRINVLQLNMLLDASDNRQQR